MAVLIVFAIWRLGAPSLPVSFNSDTTPTPEAGGPNAQFGGSSITVSGNTVSGREGNGVVQFAGSLSSISWTDTFENFYVLYGRHERRWILHQSYPGTEHDLAPSSPERSSVLAHYSRRTARTCASLLLRRRERSLRMMLPAASLRHPDWHTHDAQQHRLGHRRNGRSWKPSHPLVQQPPSALSFTTASFALPTVSQNTSVSLPFTMTDTLRLDMSGNDLTLPLTGAGLATGTFVTGGTSSLFLSTVRYDFMAIPEPSSVLLVGSGIAALLWRYRKFRIGCSPRWRWTRRRHPYSSSARSHESLTRFRESTGSPQ